MTTTKSSIRIDRCISSIRNASGPEAAERIAVIKESILKELDTAMRKSQPQSRRGTGRIVVHVLPRRFHLYGRLGVFLEVAEGEYRLDLPFECWIISDRNLNKNEFSVQFE